MYSNRSTAHFQGRLQKRKVKSSIQIDSHSLESKHCRKLKSSLYRFDDEGWCFDSTVLFDQDDEKFLQKKVVLQQKQASLRIKEVDEKGSEIKTAAKIQLDMAEYLNSSSSYFALKYDFEFNGKTGKLYFDIDLKQSFNGNKKEGQSTLAQTHVTQHSTLETQLHQNEPKLKQRPNSESNQMSKQQKSMKSILTQEPESSTLDCYMTQKEQEHDKRRIAQLEKSNEYLQKKIQELIEQKTREELKGLQMTNDNSKLNSLKAKVEEKDMQLGQALDKCKLITQKNDKNERKIRQQNKQIQRLKEQLGETKQKMANLLLQCLEMGDSDLIALVEKHYG